MGKLYSKFANSVFHDSAVLIFSFLRNFPLYLVNYAQNEGILNYKNDIQRASDFSKFERLFNQIMNKEAECFTAHLLNTTENATAFWLSNV